jgi:hypothetical protein
MTKTKTIEKTDFMFDEFIYIFLCFEFVSNFGFRYSCLNAAAGGRFILSTGDQCGRDTPFENLRAMVATARTYGRY